MRIIPVTDTDPSWGNASAPSAGGVVNTAPVIPTVDGVAANTTVTQTAQAAAGVTQQVAQSTFMPPAPVWTAIVDKNGMASAPLVAWFQTLQRRIGPYASNPTDDSLLMSDENTVDIFSRGALGDLQLGLGDTPSVRPAPDTDAWTGVELAPLVQRLIAQVDELTVQVQAIADRGWNQQPAQAATVAAAPAGGVGAAAGAWDTAAHRDTAIALLNNLKTRMDALETKLKTVRILT